MNRSVDFRKPLVKSRSIRVKPLNQRSLLLFDSAIKSEATKKNYFFLIEKFREHYLIKDYDSLISIDSKKTQIMIEDYIMYLRNKNLSYGSIHNVIASHKFGGYYFYSLSINSSAFDMKAIMNLFQ